jgi:hypothetical protein
MKSEVGETDEHGFDRSIANKEAGEEAGLQGRVIGLSEFDCDLESNWSEVRCVSQTRRRVRDDGEVALVRSLGSRRMDSGLSD